MVLGHLRLLATGGDAQPIYLAGIGEQLAHGDALGDAVAAKGRIISIHSQAHAEIPPAT